MKLSKQFLKVSVQLEKLDKKFRKTGEKGLRLWSVPRSTAELLRLLVLTKKPKTILELGTSGGYSAMWLASAAAEIKAKVFTIEMSPLKVAMARENLINSGMMKYVTIIKGDLYTTLPAWNKPIDFLFIDANKKNYLRYLKQLEPHLNKGALIVADNCSDFGDWMKDYLKYVQTSPKYASTLLEMDHGLMISVKLK